MLGCWVEHLDYASVLRPHMTWQMLPTHHHEEHHTGRLVRTVITQNEHRFYSFARPSLLYCKSILFLASPLVFARLSSLLRQFVHKRIALFSITPGHIRPTDSNVIPTTHSAHKLLSSICSPTLDCLLNAPLAPCARRCLSKRNEWCGRQKFAINVSKSQTPRNAVKLRNAMMQKA